MRKLNDKLTAQWKDAVNLVLGLSLAVSPWALNYASHATAAWNAWIVGSVIALSALSALIAFQRWEHAINAAMAGWLVVAPYLLGFSANMTAIWTQFIVGVLVAVLAIWAALSTAEVGDLASRS